MITTVAQFIAEQKKAALTNEEFETTFDDSVDGEELENTEVEETEEDVISLSAFTAALNTAIEVSNEELEEGEEPTAQLTEKQLELAFSAFMSLNNEEEKEEEKEEEQEEIEDEIEPTDEGLFDKIKTGLLGTIPAIEKLVAELPKKIEKNKAAYEAFKKIVDLKKFDGVTRLLVSGSDQKFPFTVDNLLAVAGYFDFAGNLIGPANGGVQFKRTVGQGVTNSFS